MANKRLAGLALVLLIAGLSLSAFPVVGLAATPFANDAFARTYAANPGLWGTPGQVLNEQYAGAKNGSRQVQYFEQGRMEATRPDIQPNFVGDGKLVVEMVSGRMQVGDTLYWQYDGAEMPIAGGGTFLANPGAPSYRAFQSLTGAVLSRVGRPITAVLNPAQGEGFLLGITSLGTDPALGTLARYAAYVPESGHNLPDVFWRYLNQTDANGLPLFNWQSLFGLPITDSYWAKVYVGDQPHDILVQLFERRTLLYDPAAVAGSQVTSGPVGRDYYRWRYEQPELPVVDTSFTPPNNTPNTTVQPLIGEAGTTFKIGVSGLQANENVSLYLRLGIDRGVYSQRLFQADSQGHLNLRGRTRPLQTPTEEYYLTFTGQSSGTTATAHYKVIGSIRYTPAVEAVQPGDVPANQGATFDKTSLRIGDEAKLVAAGFGPGEYLKGWITTPLNRVVGWVGLVNSSSTLNTHPYLLKTDAQGVMRLSVPAPGVAEPGIYAFTLYGPTSLHTAIVYFRVKAGPATLFDPVWGQYDYDAQPRPAEAQPVDVATLAQHADQYRQTPPYIEIEEDR